MKKIYAILPLITLIMVTTAYSQHPLSLYYLENVPQSVMLNPANAPRANSFIGIPVANMVYVNYYSDMVGSDIFQKTSTGKWGTFTNPEYDFSKFDRMIKKAANLRLEQSVQDIYFGFSGKKGYFTFGIAEKLNQSVNMPASFFSILDKGFPDGSQLELSAFALNANYYREISAGYSYKFMDNLRIGANVKILQGLASVKTDITTLKLNTGRDVWDINIDGAIYMSAPVEVYSNDKGIPDSLKLLVEGVDDGIKYGLLNFSNPGLAIDFGAVYQYNRDWKFSASVIDLGFIRWNSNLNTISANGTYNFMGINIDGSNIDSIGNAADAIIDSLKTAVNTKNSNQPFATSIGTKIYLGAQYNVNHYFNVGLLSRTSIYRNDVRQEFNASANLNLYHVLTANINTTVSLTGVASCGFGLGLRGGLIQYYMALDYIPYSYRYYTIDVDGEKILDNQIAPSRFNNFNVVLGLNIIIGANGFKNNPMIDEYSEF